MLAIKALSIMLVCLCASLAGASITLQVSDSSGKPVMDAVVYAENASTAASNKTAVAEIQQQDKKFMPLVSVAQVGTAISFPNNDTVRHHAYSFSPAKPFELKLYAGKPEAPIIFDKPGTVVIGCNIHDQMVAYVQVVKTPYFAKTDTNGIAKINAIPAGKYLLNAWHYKQLSGSPAYEQNITVTEVDTTVQVKFAFKTN